MKPNVLLTNINQHPSNKCCLCFAWLVLFVCYLECGFEIVLCRSTYNHAHWYAVIAQTHAPLIASLCGLLLFR